MVHFPEPAGYSDIDKSKTRRKIGRRLVFTHFITSFSRFNFEEENCIFSPGIGFVDIVFQLAYTWACCHCPIGRPDAYVAHLRTPERVEHVRVVQREPALLPRLAVLSTQEQPPLPHHPPARYALQIDQSHVYVYVPKGACNLYM